MRKSNGSGGQKKNPLHYLFAAVWHYSAGHRNKIVWYWSMFVVAEAIQLIIYPMVMAKIIDVIQKQGITTDTIQILLLLLLSTLVIEIAFWLLHGPARLIEEANAFRIRTNYRKYLLKGVMTLPMKWHVEHHSGDIIDKIEKGTSALFQFSKNSFQIIYAGIRLIISYAMLVYFSWSAGYIVLAMILATAWITMRFDAVLIDHYRELNRAENSVSESIFDGISNIATVIILRVERLVFTAIMRKVEKPFELFKRNNRVNEVKWFLTNMCCALMAILVLGAYFWQNIGTANGVLVAKVYILITYLDKVSDLFFKFANLYGEILQQRGKVFNAEELSKDFVDENFINHVLPENWKQVEIKGLNFSHHTEEKTDLHLANISLTVHRGERIAFVGKSGSGKSTLMSIMRDIYQPQSMTLLVDGAFISGFDGISRAIALIPQDPEIFATTILENITLGAEYEEGFVKRFTDMACFTEVIAKLPHGLNSSIKEKGVNLSGGQQQRLALARGFLACTEKDIVLLDEPTSSLDTVTEMEVYQNIFREFSDKTVISSIHRLHLLPLFDRIYFMNEGQIIAFGSLTELLRACPEFQELWQQYNQHRQEAPV